MPKKEKILIDNVRPQDCVSILLSIRKGMPLRQDDLETKAVERGVVAVESLFRTVNRLADLGIVKKDERKRVTLTDFGGSVKGVLIRDEPLFYEVMHNLHMLSSFDKRQKPYFKIYYLITMYLYMNRRFPGDGAASEIITDVMGQIEKSVDPSERPSLDKSSVGKVIWWLSSLDPPFVIPGHKRGKEQFVPRVNPRAETIMLAISSYYSILDLPYGTPFLLDGSAIRNISIMGLVDESSLVNALPALSASYRTLELMDTVHGKSLILRQRFSVEDLA